MFPGQLRSTVQSGNTVILNIKNHFIIIDKVEVVNGVSYYMTRDPYMGSRGIATSVIDRTIENSANAVIVRK